MNSQPMTTILLSGSLAQKFGRRHEKAIDSGQTREVFSALQHTVEGWTEEIMRMSRAGIRFAIFRNRVNVGEKEFTLGGTREIRIVPIIAGSKNGGIFQVVLGVALIVVGVFTGGSTTALGISMVLGGVAQLLTPTPKTPNQQEQATTENKPSYIFNGAFNSTQQGLPVPVIYGQMLVGSTVVAVGTWSEALPT